MLKDPVQSTLDSQLSTLTSRLFHLSSPNPAFLHNASACTIHIRLTPVHHIGKQPDTSVVIIASIAFRINKVCLLVSSSSSTLENSFVRPFNISLSTDACFFSVINMLFIIRSFLLWLCYLLFFLFDANLQPLCAKLRQSQNIFSTKHLFFVKTC